MDIIIEMCPWWISNNFPSFRFDNIDRLDILRQEVWQLGEPSEEIEMDMKRYINLSELHKPVTRFKKSFFLCECFADFISSLLYFSINKLKTYINNLYLAELCK